ncbi:MAG: DUF4386 domain-containing protein [Nanoarchaeota archaeon]
MGKNKSNRKTAIIVGVLILIAYGVLVSVITESKITVMFFEVISGIAVIGIAVLMFPIFKPYNKKLTLSYLFFKTIEGALLIVAGILFLSLNTLLFEARNWIYIIQTHIFILSAFMFYYLLYKSKLIPRFISVWGVIALILVLIVNLLEITGNIPPMQILFLGYFPIILNEVFLAIWLIIKGFNLPKK